MLYFCRAGFVESTDRSTSLSTYVRFAKEFGDEGAVHARLTELAAA